MMTNPHNHLYCEQYAEVGTPLDVCRQACSQSMEKMSALCEWCLLCSRDSGTTLHVTGTIDL